MTRPQDTTPANPVQGVSELLERSADHVKMAKAIGNFGIASRLVAELSEALTAAIGAGGQAVAEARKLLLWAADSFEAHAKCTKVCDEIDGYEESAKMFRECASRLSQSHPADEQVVEALPRPDAVSMASGTICLEYVDRDERDLAFDWLEAHGAGVALAASHMPVGDGQKYRLLEAGEIIASDDEFIGDDGITWERVKGWPVGYTYTHIFKSCRRPLAAARAREDGK